MKLIVENVGYVSIQGEGLQYWTVHLDRFTHHIRNGKDPFQTGVID